MLSLNCSLYDCWYRCTRIGIFAKICTTTEVCIFHIVFNKICMDSIGNNLQLQPTRSIISSGAILQSFVCAIYYPPPPHQISNHVQKDLKFWFLLDGSFPIVLVGGWAFNMFFESSHSRDYFTAFCIEFLVLIASDLCEIINMSQRFVYGVAQHGFG